MEVEDIKGKLTILGTAGSDEFLAEVDGWLQKWGVSEGTAIIKPQFIRFGTGEAKTVITDSMRNHDIYIFADMFNHGATFKMYGKECPMSPDDHFQDLKRLICSFAGKGRRVNVIMPMIYEGRQDKRTLRESLDAAISLKELADMGVCNIISFDIHNIGIQNAIPMCSFDNVHPTYQMIKALVNRVPDIAINRDKLMMISPDEGGMNRCMYYSSVLKLELGTFYKRRDYTVVKDGKNPIKAHQYLGRSVRDKDVIVVDDIISSGESVLDVARQLKSRGAKRVFVFASFGLFCNGLKKFDRAYRDGLIDQIFTTNLIYRTPELKERPWYTEVNMCKYVALMIATLHVDCSISKLLNPVDRINELIATKLDENGVLKPEFKEDAETPAEE
ncbi:MAG: ribose-phosphate pyrophosphokinase [Clostridia bacterium]|nr:ribose-phosphate pyrophosphokinase [Clostridia bacterium]